MGYDAFLRYNIRTENRGVVITIQGKNWNIEDYVTDPKTNIENTVITEEKIQENYSLSDNQIKKIRYTINKRHPNDNWITSRVNILNNKVIRNYDIEAIDWINSVYFRDSSINWLDAEIEFTIKHIERLEHELNIKDENLLTVKDGSLYSIAKLLNISYTNLKEKIEEYEKKNHVSILYKNDSDILYVKAAYLNTMSGRHIKKYKLNCLNDYKIRLQKLKQLRGNSNA